MKDRVEDLFHKVDDGPNWVGAFGTISTFGGKHDPGDAGGTASGFSTFEHDAYPYVALPIPVRRKYNLKWGMAVILQKGDVVVCGFLCDIGPTATLMRIADVSAGLMKMLGGSGLLDGVRVTFRP